MPHEIDYDQLGASVAKHLHAICTLGLTSEDVLALKEFTCLWTHWKSAKWKAFSAIITLTVIGVASLLLSGIATNLKKMFQ